MASHKVSAKRSIVAGGVMSAVHSELLDRISAATATWHLALAVIVVLIASIWVGDGGLLHIESANYLVQHLSARPLWPLIFDSRALDNNMYQARELSYLLDRIDCYFIAYSTALGVPHFLSLIHYTFSFLSSILAWFLFVRYFRLDRLSSLLLTLLFITSPTVFLDCFYLRSAKIAVTLLVAVIAVEVTPILMLPPELQAKQNWIQRGSVLFLLCFTMTLLDRQGFFFAVLLAGFFALCYFIAPGAANAVYFTASAGACLIETCYNYWVAPAICHALNGFWPSMAYQGLPWAEFRAHPWQQISSGALLFINALRYFAGDLPVGVAVCVCFALAVVISCDQRTPDLPGTQVLQTARCWLFHSLTPLLLILLVAMNTLMYLRHPSILWEDIQRVYYWTPQTFVILILAGFALSLLQRHGLNMNVVRFALAILVFSNAVALPSHWKSLRYGHLADRYTAGALYRANLKNIGVPGAVPPDLGRAPLFLSIEKRALAFRSFWGITTPGR